MLLWNRLRAMGMREGQWHYLTIRNKVGTVITTSCKVRIGEK